MKFSIMCWLSVILISKCSLLMRPDTKINYVQFETILSENHLKGTIVIYSEAARAYYCNDYQRAEEGFLPASTFKILNTLVALEEGITDTLGNVFLWNGKENRPAQWERDMTLMEAFQFSCVPCFQALAREIGVNKMREYIDCTGYGRMDVNDENIDRFWLVGNSRITPMEQIGFLRVIYNNKSDCFSGSTYRKLKDIMVFDVGETFVMRAKTGWSISHGQNIGWFVGYVETDSDTWFFATNVEPLGDPDKINFAAARLEVTYQALELLDVIHPPEGF
jgi:beta-lactamase class D OXA-209